MVTYRTTRVNTQDCVFTQPVRHVFVYVVDRPDDPFAGIKRELNAQADKHEVCNVRLSSSTYKTVGKVEYSIRKHFRYLYYESVFRELNNMLENALVNNRGASIVYFSDEGVWAEFFKRFRRLHGEMVTASVNVQHGFEHLVKPRYKWARKLANQLGSAILGFPAFGMGCFGGAGSGVFDIYLTYDENTAEFIYGNTADRATPAPQLIKSRLFEEYKEYSDGSVNEGRVLFALQPRIVGTNIKCDPAEVLILLEPIAEMLKNNIGGSLVLRRHPGIPRELFEQEFKRSRISHFAQLDEKTRLAESLACSELILSFDSTVLWEAAIVGKTAASVQCRCFRATLPFKHDILDMEGDWEKQLTDLIAKGRETSLASEKEKREVDWCEIVGELIRKKRK